MLSNRRLDEDCRPFSGSVGSSISLAGTAIRETNCLNLVLKMNSAALIAVGKQCLLTELAKLTGQNAEQFLR